MSLAVQLTSNQLKAITEDEKNLDERAREAQELGEDGGEVLDPGNTSSVLNRVLNRFNHKFEHKGLDEAFGLHNARTIHKSPDDHGPGCMYSIPGLQGTMFLVDQGLTTWFIVRRWVCDADMAEALVANKMGLGKTFTSVAVVMLS
jgi:hypothetical protein